MATRYSGSIMGRLEYVDSKSEWRVRLRCEGESKTVWVRESAKLTKAVDSPEMYDSIFQTSISFADWSEHAEYSEDNGHPVKVYRKKPEYWTGK
jgi:predicted RNA-binding protein with PUA domain